MAELHGNGKSMSFKVKIPLSKDTIQNYQFSEILEEENDEENIAAQDAKVGILKNLKYWVYRTAVQAGVMDKVRIDTDLELFHIDPKYIQSVKVNKVFFALEDCPKGDNNCRRRTNGTGVSFKLIDKFFINASMLDDDDETLLDLEEFEGKSYGYKFYEGYSDSLFDKAAKKAFSEESDNFNKFYDGRDLEKEDFKELNIANFEYSRKYKKNERVQKDMQRYYTISLPEDLTHDERLHLFQMLKRPAFNNIISDYTLIGNNFYVEITSTDLHKRFFEVLEQEGSSVTRLGLNGLDKCEIHKCATIASNQNNLVPFLKRNDKIRLETYLSLNDLDINDFYYNGFIEVELELNFGL